LGKLEVYMKNKNLLYWGLVVVLVIILTFIFRSNNKSEDAYPTTSDSASASQSSLIANSRTTPETSMTGKQIVHVYFSNQTLNPGTTCEKVFPVERQINKTPAVGRASLLELLTGPTAGEKADGYFSNINKGTKIQKLAVANNIASVDFDSHLEEAVLDTCTKTAIRAQISETLKQFSTVKDVLISIDGQIQPALQP